MKRIIYSLTLCLMFLGFVACEDETTQDNSKVTYYAEITLKGDASVFWNLGTPWEDPGYTAIMKGEDVSNLVEIKTNLNVNKGGVYTIDYTVTNEDGISRSTSRTVYVSDPTPTPITSGVWTVTADSYRMATVTSTYGAEFPITILQVSPGKFYINDFLGGWYEQRAGYGSSYACSGHFLLDENNIREGAGDGYVPGWGDSYDTATGFVNDDGSISLTVEYVGMTFNITMTYN